IMAALWNRARGAHRSTGVEVVDVALFEGLFRIIPTQIAAYDQLGQVAMRPGNKLTSHGVLRNLFQSRDGRWFVVSAVGPAAIGRVLAAAGATAQIARLAEGVMLEEPSEVVAFLDECDALFGQWAAAQDYAVLSEKLTAADAVHQLVYTAEDIMHDRQFHARGDLITVPDEALGPITMQGIIPKFPKRDHAVHRAGPDRGADNAEVFGKLLDIDEAALNGLRNDGIV
ncbi:MAG: CoA transferase, partial [Actinomycetota bacterium]|nr:CoA transferase [Actinomycetota bacterium]